MARLLTSINHWLGGEKKRVLLLGSNPRVRLLAAALGMASRPVSWIKLDIEEGDIPSPGVNVIYGAEPWETTLTRAGADEATCLIASTCNTDLNQRICHLAQQQFGLRIAILRLCLVSGVTTWARLTDTGMRRMEWSDVLNTVCGDKLSNQVIEQLSIVREHDRMVDVELRSPAFAGRPIGELKLGDCEVVGITRNGVLLPASELNHIELSDIVTLTGSTEAVDKVRESFTSL